MSGRLKVQEFMVIAGGGVPVFHYSFTGARRLNELLSGFLSAITSFASEFGERSVQSLSFKGSEILYEQAGKNVLFVLLVDSGAPVHILRAILRDLGRKFLMRYEDVLDSPVMIEEAFSDFETEIHRAVNYYEGLLLVTSNLGPFVVPVVNREALTLFQESAELIDEFHRTFPGGGRVIDAIDGERTLKDIASHVGMDVDTIMKVVEFLAIWGVVDVYRLCPSIRQGDERFDAFLDLIGLREREYRLLKRARMLCNGSRSLEAVSNKLGVQPEELYSVLLKLGDEVEWKKMEIGGMSRPTRPV